jgi:hypothetical protein
VQDARGVLGGREHLKLGDDRVVVVGLVGSSVFGKAELANNLAGSAVWKDSLNLDRPSAIKLLHQHDKNTILLHLDGLCDFPFAMEMAENMTRMAGNGSLHGWMADTDTEHFKALLYMFLVCHVVLVTQDGPRVDVRVLQTLRLLQQAKQAIGPALQAQLFGHTSDARDNLRHLLPSQIVPCILFVFRVLPSMLVSSRTKSGQGEANKSFRTENLAVKLQQSLEKQLTFLLRKLKATEGDSNSTLFSLPQLSHPAVFVLEENSSDDMLSVFDDIFGDGFAEAMLPFGGLGRFAGSNGGFDHAMWSGTDTRSQISENDIGALRAFVHGQISQKLDAFSAPDTQSNRGSEQPSSAEWFVKATLLHDIFLFGEQRQSSIPPSLIGQLARFAGSQNTQNLFSEKICQLALPHARRVYAADLPEFYTSQRHEEQVRIRLLSECCMYGALRFV